MSQELVALAEQLIGFETVDTESISECAGFVQGWLEARGIEVRAGRGSRAAGGEGRGRAR